MPRYLLDTNIFIQGRNSLPQDIFPGYWERLGGLLKSGRAILHQTVLDELKKHDDELVPWLKGIEGLKPMATTAGALLKYVEICAWADTSDAYTRQAKREFTEQTRADAWLCAETVSSGLVLVSNEKRQRTPNKIKIPNVCDVFGGTCISGFDFMRAEGFRF